MTADTDTYTDTETIKAELQRQLLAGSALIGAPWDVAEDMELLGYAEIRASKYERKTADELRVNLTRSGVAAAGSPPCGGSGSCAVCNGDGEHWHDADVSEGVECPACDGSGDCPCRYDASTATHAAPWA